MSFMVVNSEYDMDVALAETMKLIEFTDKIPCEIELGFNTRPMADIFIQNLMKTCKKKKINPSQRRVSISIFIEKGVPGDTDGST